MTEPDFSQHITLPWLEGIAESRFFERGEAYFDEGRVTALVEENETISAEVEGTEIYRVDFWKEHGEVVYDCTCPVGDQDLFCKHCVAAGLAWLAGQHASPKKSKPSKKTPLTLTGLRRFLENQEKEELLELIFVQAKKDTLFREQLFLKMTCASGQEIDLKAFKKTLDRAIKIRGFVHYRDAYAYTQKVQRVVESVATLFDAGHADSVIVLSEYGLKTLEKALESMDDSDGGMNELLYQFQELHLSACKVGTPDVEALASRLFDWEFRGDWDTFSGAALTYTDILGKKGRAVYQKLAEIKWKKVKPLGPNEEDRNRYGIRFKITHIMESLAKASGDIEALVAVKRKDLSSAYDYLKIAEIYKSAQENDKALQWAELGLQVFPNKTDDRLRQFLADEYHRLKRHDEAIRIIWTAFNEELSLSKYQDLKKHSNRNKQWSSYREKALSLLRARYESVEQEMKKPHWKGQNIDHSELVRIFLWEKEVELAWAEAKSFECSDALWMELADLRQEKHPEESLIIYQCQIAPILEYPNNQAYKEATQFLLKINKLMLRLKRSDEFFDYLESIRASYKRKRNFMKLLDGTRWDA